MILSPEFTQPQDPPADPTVAERAYVYNGHTQTWTEIVLSSYQRTNAALYVAVSSTGSDASNTNRDGMIGGDFTTWPYLTLATALDELPKILGHATAVRVGAGTFVGSHIWGFVGGKDDAGSATGLVLRGTTSTATATTGLATFTAGAGTTSTSIVKQTGSANWTASDFLGKFLKVTGGAGVGTTDAPVIRPIKANTTTTITVDAISGADSTTTCEIVDMGTIFTESADGESALKLSYNTCPVTIRNVKFSGAMDYGIRSVGNACVIFDACMFDDASTVIAAMSSLRDARVTFKNCILKSGNHITIQECGVKIDSSNMYLSASGTVTLEDCHSGDIRTMVSTAAVSNVLRAERMGVLYAEVNASNGAAASPIYLESVDQFEAVGTKLLGSSNTGGYGIEIAKNGRYTLTGSTVTGSLGDVLFMDNVVTWANLSSATYGIAEEHTGSAMANATWGKSLKYGNYLFNGSIDVSGRLLLYGYLNLAMSTSATNLTNATPLDMETAGLRAGGIFNCTHASGNAVLPSGAAIAGVLVIVVNIGTNDMTVAAPSGGALTGSATVSASGGKGIFLSLHSGSGKDFIRLV